MASICDTEIINPLHQVEAVLENIETWSSNIIKLIFIDDYDRKNISNSIFFLWE